MADIEVPDDLMSFNSLPFLGFCSQLTLRGSFLSSFCLMERLLLQRRFNFFFNQRWGAHWSDFCFYFNDRWASLKFFSSSDRWASFGIFWILFLSLCFRFFSSTWAYVFRDCFLLSSAAFDFNLQRGSFLCSALQILFIQRQMEESFNSPGRGLCFFSHDGRSFNSPGRGLLW